MPDTSRDQEIARLERELKIQRQIAFASGMFQEDVTVRTLLESIGEGFVVIDSSGAILLVNSAAAQMFGYSSQDLVGQPHSLLVPERFRRAHEEHEKRYFEAPRRRPMGQLLDLAGCRRDGSEFPLEISLGFLETAHGPLVLALVSDMTLRKEYEARLQESDDLFRIQVECVKDYAVFMLDARGNVLNWNAGAERLNGYPADEIVGRPFSRFYPEVDRQAGKSDEVLRRAAKEGRVEDEGWRLRKDGSRFWADVLLTALHDEQGNLRGFSMVTHDITERKRAAAALQESEELFHATFDQAAVGIAHVDPDHRLLRVNGKICEILGYPEDELKGLTIRDITHPDDLETSLKHFRLLMEGKLKNYSLEKRYLRKDGSTAWMKLTVSAVVDPGGNLKFAVGVMEDISARMRAEREISRLNEDLKARAAELEAANRESEAFNYTVAHDLRKPLTVVNGYCQAIKEVCGDKLGEPCAGFLQEAFEGTLRMNRLIEALLQFSRLARVEPCRETVDLSAMAQEVAEELKLAEPQRRVAFLSAEGVTVDGDANLLRVVLDNLLGNAWKYTAMREEAVIEFGTTEVGGRQACFVRDNGAGFAMAEAEKLFIPFQRLPGAEDYRGFGIGLATVERIIQRHGGRIWAEGEPGVGATFYFTLAGDGA